MQEAIAAIHQANRRRQPLTFEYASYDGRVGLYCRVPDELVPLVAGPLKAKYPNCSLSMGDEGVAPIASNSVPPATMCAELTLTPDLFPLLRHSQFEDIASGSFEDPIDALLQSITPDDHTTGRIEIHVRPTARWRCRRIRRAITILDGPRFRRRERLSRWYARLVTQRWLWPLAFLLGLGARVTDVRFRSQIETTAGRHHEREDDLQAASDKLGRHLFDVRICLVVQQVDGTSLQSEHRLQAMVGAFGSFTASRLATFRTVRRRRGSSPSLRGSGFLLSHEELATLFHPPTADVAVEKMHTTDFAELEAPQTFHSKESEGGIVLGRVRFRDDRRLVTLGPKDRRRHLYVVGRTGVGKSTLLLNLLTADINAGRGVGLLDPHGDLADQVIGVVPPQRTNDVIVFDPSDSTYAVGFNPLQCSNPARRDLVADDVVSAFNKIYDLTQTPRLKDTLRNALYVLIEQEESLVSLLLLLSDASYRDRVVARAEDDVARLFWTREFATWNERYRTEALSAIQNKVRPFLMNRSIRAIVGQKGPTLDLRQVMDDGKVLIANLSKGRIGEDNANLLGALLASSLQQAAMSRADIPEEQRCDFFLTVDEFQNYRTGSFASMLSEARKYRLCVTVAHQYLRQLDEETSNAVFGNVGSLVSFQVSGDDAENLARHLSQFPGQARPADLANLPKYTAYVRLVIDGMPSRPFSLETLPPPDTNGNDQRADAVRSTSQRRNARRAEQVHELIRKRFALT